MLLGGKEVAHPSIRSATDVSTIKNKQFFFTRLPSYPCPAEIFANNDVLYSRAHLETEKRSTIIQIQTAARPKIPMMTKQSGMDRSVMINMVTP